MLRNRSPRSLIALVTALMMLACQVAFAAEACATSVRAMGDSMAAMPCHDAQGDAGSPTDKAPAANVCEAAKAVVDPAKVPVLALADLPAASVTYLKPMVPAAATRIVPTHVVCSSPPLAILHCRLLN